MPSKPVSIVLFGLGPIGRAVGGALQGRRDLKVVGAVDIDPALVGRPLESLWRPGSRRGPRVVEELAAVRGDGKGRVLVHAAGSRLRQATPQFRDALSRGYRVVSSCEELFWPWLAAPGLARQLDRCARRHRTAIFGTGVNPGFIMDLLPAALSALSLDVTRVDAWRHVDVARRRSPLQRKVGVGMEPAHFRSLARTGEIGHVGLPESAHALAAALGWALDSWTNRIEPVVGTMTRRRPVQVRPGQVIGMRQVVRGRRHDRDAIRLQLTMALGAEPEVDRIRLRGRPGLDLEITGGVPGDTATVAALINGVFAIHQAEPGLRTGLDLPLPRGRGRP